jgi:hypothetical protein
MRRMLFRKHPPQDVPNWSWEEHGHQNFQRLEGAEQRGEIAMVVVALLIVAAIAARLGFAWMTLPT